MEPFREKRAYYEARKNEVKDIIHAGSEKANKIGDKTVEAVKKSMQVYL